jgi:serine/threonine-protein kinase RsbW
MPAPVIPTAHEGFRYALVVRNDLAELQRVSRWLEVIAMELKWPHEITLELDLCLTEVVTNVIHYAYEDTGVHGIALSLQHQGPALCVEVEDDGKHFNPLDADPPVQSRNLEEAQAGGWGIHLVRSIMADLRYRHHEGKNRLTMLYRHAALKDSWRRHRHCESRQGNLPRAVFGP